MDTIVSPRLQRVGYLGHGARSTILLVVDQRDGRQYALKRVPKRTAEDIRFIEQTEIEYAVSRQFTHPVLRKSYSLKRIRRWLRLVEVQLLMEYFPGRNLEEFQAGTAVPQLEAIFVKVAEGLLSLHQLGYLHADIKPNNILVNPASQEVRIIDFGQACRIGATKERVQGTPDYIAPEQVRCQPLDQRTDVFNLGATMYWMLTGKPWPTMIPGKQMRPGQMLLHKGEPWLRKPPIELNPKVSPALSRLVMDCCQDSPSERPKDMREVLSRLQISQTIADSNHGH